MAIKSLRDIDIRNVLKTVWLFSGGCYKDTSFWEITLFTDPFLSNQGYKVQTGFTASIVDGVIVGTVQCLLQLAI